VDESGGKEGAGAPEDDQGADGISGLAGRFPQAPPEIFV
jgi:hypothetical protein